MSLSDFLKAQPIEEEVEDPVEPPVTPVKPQEPPRLRIYRRAIECLGKDISPREDELGCAEAISTGILHPLFPEFPAGILSTQVLYKLLTDKRYGFKSTLDLLPGNIILSVTGQGNGTIEHGHVGVLGYGGEIMSNDSRKKLFLKNYSLDGWIERYRKHGGYPILVFERMK